jgi:fatty-acyl-CoA synthase
MFHANAWGLPYSMPMVGSKFVFPGPKMGDGATLAALIQIVLFYFTVSVTGGLVLLVVLFNRHRRTLHDILSHLVVLRRVPAGTATAMPPR